MKTLPSNEAINILRDMLSITTKDPLGVDVKRYRVEHRTNLKDIDWLDHNRLIERFNEGNHYQITLLGLFFSDSADADALFHDIDRICECLSQHYEKNFSDHVQITDLADELAMSHERARECITYMVDGSVLAIRSTDLYQPDAYVGPSEGILNAVPYKAIPESRLGTWYQEMKNGVPSDKAPHGNTEVNASKREAILGAALAVLAKYPDQCRSGTGNVQGSKIAKLIEEKSPILFKSNDGIPPFEPAGVAKTINKWIKSLD